MWLDCSGQSKNGQLGSQGSEVLDLVGYVCTQRVSTILMTYSVEEKSLASVGEGLEGQVRQGAQGSVWPGPHGGRCAVF